MFFFNPLHLHLDIISIAGGKSYDWMETDNLNTQQMFQIKYISCFFVNFENNEHDEKNKPSG